MDEIEDLKKNCERLAKTEIIIEKKMKIAYEVIKELGEKLSNAEKLETVAPSEEIVNLRLEILYLKNDISEKENLLNDIANENKLITEELRKTKDNPIAVLDVLQVEETISLSEELGNEYKIAKSFECTFCGKLFQKGIS